MPWQGEVVLLMRRLYPRTQRTLLRASRRVTQDLHRWIWPQPTVVVYNQRTRQDAILPLSILRFLVADPVAPSQHAKAPRASVCHVSMAAPSAPRDARSKIPPGPEGSNGIDRRGRRGQPAGQPPFPASALQLPSRLATRRSATYYPVMRAALGTASATHSPGLATRWPR
jgi:hypothetical protein